MNSKLRLWPLLLATVILGGIGVGLWQFGGGRISRPPERRVLYYQDSMHPHVKSDQPGKCRICGMDLTPIYSGQPGFALGNDVVMRPLATPVIGGMLSSLIHILIVTPVLFAWLRERELRSPLESTGLAQFSTPQPAQLQLVVGNGPAQT